MPEFSAVVPVKIVDATVDFGPDAELAFSFDANKVTPQWFADQKRKLIEDNDVLTVGTALAAVIVDWNLTEADQPMPVTPDVLTRFPMGHLNLLMTAIAEQPTRAEGEASSALSQAQSPAYSVSASTPPNGVATSGSQTPSASLSPT